MADKQLRQWVFVPGRTKDSYKIQNVLSISDPPTLWLFVDSESVSVSADDSEATEFLLRFEKGGKNCRCATGYSLTYTFGFSTYYKLGAQASRVT